MRYTYVIVRKGVYVQDVYGPYSDPNEAIRDAGVLAAKEKDNYHTFYVTHLDRKGLFRPDWDDEDRCVIIREGCCL